MKKIKKFYVVAFIALVPLFFLSCEKDDTESIDSENIVNQVPDEVLEQIRNLGYRDEGVQLIETAKNGTGYLVEGDMILHADDLERDPSEGIDLRIAEVEQYRTNLVPTFGSSYYSSRLGQMVYRKEQIIVLMDDTFPNVYWQALQEVANRYTAVSGLRFTIEPYLENNGYNPRASSIDINIRRVNAGYLAAAGSPREVTRTTRGGTTYTEIEPYNEILVSPGTIGNEGADHIATIIAHEIGHCIGFRHTDYFNRRYSCGVEYRLDGTPIDPNEDIEWPEDNPGSVHIPGTPTDEDANSWMLACIGNGVNRPFIYNDRIALRYLHGF